MDTNQKLPTGEGHGGQKPHHGKRRPYHKHHGKSRRPQEKQEQPDISDVIAENRDREKTATVVETPAQATGEEKNRPANNGKRSRQGHQNNRHQGQNKEGRKTAPDAVGVSEEIQPLPEGEKHERSTKENRTIQSKMSIQSRNANKETTPVSEETAKDFSPLMGDDTEAERAERIEAILSYDIFNISRPVIPEVIPEGKIVIAGIRFRPGGKTYYFAPGELNCHVGDHAIVETARGLEFGEVYIENRMVDEDRVVAPLRPVIRIATHEDIAQNQANKAKEDEAFRIGKEEIAKSGLGMKLLSAQYTFDGAKLLFYFTSDGRVDFRELVKTLAGIFRTRIELRQVGIRDEARMLGGLGNCGRPLCCSSFLADFVQVSMKMAKEQNLSLNSQKISGCCGRLMCCLRYEHETYEEALRELPSQGSFVITPDGPGMVTDVLPLEGAVKVSVKSEENNTAPKKYLKQELTLPANHRRSAPQTIEDIAEPDADD